MKAFYCIPFLLYACGSDTPSFVEIPEGIIMLSVNDEAGADDEASDATVFGGEADFGSADAVADTNTDGDSDADADASMSPSDGARNSDSGRTSPAVVSDEPVSAQTVLKACAPFLKGQAKKIRVVDADGGPLNLKIAPDTALAFKITGNQSKLTIRLPAGNDLPGVCFFVTGNQSQVTFASESLVSSFTWFGHGNQSAGTVAFLGGSPVEAHVELKGNSPTLKVQGLDSDLCQQERLQCSP